MTDHLHFAGDVTPVDGRQLFGPDTASGVYVATAAHYDPDADRTTVSLRPLSGDERRERIKQIVADEQRILRIRRLFGTAS
jgi:hypothetical protein